MLKYFNCTKKSKNYERFKEIENLWDEALFNFEKGHVYPNLNETKKLIETIQIFCLTGNLNPEMGLARINYIGDFLSRIIIEFFKAYSTDSKISKEYIAIKTIGILKFIRGDNKGQRWFDGC